MADDMFGFMMGFCIGALVILIVMLFMISDYENKLEQLGQSICDQEYGLDFDYYSDGILYCQPAEQIEPYDGIQVSIGDGG